MTDAERQAVKAAAHPILSAWMRACFAGARRRNAVDFRCGMDMRDAWVALGGAARWV